MNKYLSFGGGVNSVALLLLLKDEGEDFETVFVNHNGDYPETYEYIHYLKNEGYKITEIKPNYYGFDSIYDYAVHYKILPFRFPRWCTRDFKIKPLINHYVTPCIEYIGISYEEKKRAEKLNKKDVNIRFPLIDAKLNRNDCIEIIKKHDLILPSRSMCYFCPFQTKNELLNLYHNHRDLYKKVKYLEHINCRGYTLKSKPIEDIVHEYENLNIFKR